jgi:hypothetical protein
LKLRKLSGEYRSHLTIWKTEQVSEAIPSG